MRTTNAHDRAPVRCARVVRMRRREYYPTPDPYHAAKETIRPSPDLAVDLSRRSGRGENRGRGEEIYWIVLLTVPVGALSTPELVYDEMLKYHVPAASPSMTADVTPAPTTSSTLVSEPGEVP